MRGQELTQSEEGRDILRTAQAQALTILVWSLGPRLSHWAQAALSAAERGDGLLRELEGSSEGQKLITWGRQKLQEAQDNPESLQGGQNLCSFQAFCQRKGRFSGLISSMDFSKGVWTPWKELLTRARDDLGLDVKLEGRLGMHVPHVVSPRLIAGGRRYLETDRATELLRTAQERALHLTKAKVSIESYVQKLEAQSPKSRAPESRFMAH